VTQKTTVHVMRHGEVHNPEKVLYGRLPDFHLSERGRRQAQSAADWLARNDVVYVVSSPLERAGETAAPIAAVHGLSIDTDEDLIESWNHFEGEKVSPGDGALRDPRNWPKLRNPRTPSWGEPYEQVATRMQADRDAAPGPGPGGGPRSGLRQPPVAGGDAASRGDRPEVAPSPAAAQQVVQPRLDHVVHVRGRHADPLGLHGAVGSVVRDVLA